MLTLVVVPPALGLPSLDPECLATISYMNSAVKSEWEVVADANGTLASKTGTWQGLPALWDGDVLVSGYDRIVEHLKETSKGQWDLDQHLSSRERASQYGALCTVSTRLRPLISLLLYTSPENYVKVTRPALGSILSFPTSWVLPVHHRDHQQSIASSLGISSDQLSAAAASLTAKRKTQAREGESSARVNPLDDEEIVRPKPVTDYIPFFGSTSAALSVHRGLRQVVKETLGIYASYSQDTPQLLHNDHVPTSLGCALYSHLALAIAAAVRITPHPFVTSVLHHEFPDLEKLVETWMDDEWDFELRGSKAKHARLRRAAANRTAIESLPWKKADSSIAQSSRALAANWARAAGWMRSWSDSSFLDTRDPLQYDESGAVVYTDGKGMTQGRGMGHQTDLLVGATVAASTLILGYQAWQEGF